MENLLAVALGVGTIVGNVMMGCGGDTPLWPSQGTGASSAGGDGSGGNPSMSSGSSSSSGGGAGGFGGCSTAADCSDGLICTIDTCNEGVCGHVIGPDSGPTACLPGKVCQLGFGCDDRVICADDAQCMAQLATDPCKANINCDLAASVCRYSRLDKDNDGQSPLVCEGLDCDDSNSQTYAGAVEICDGKDNNCDGTRDEDATCPGLRVCQEGACTCPSQYACGDVCVDKMTSNTHCGTCDNACLGAASCMNGQCVCPAGAVTCGGICIDTMNNPLNCGGCNVPCPAGLACQNGMCQCPMQQVFCDGQCVNAMTNMNHCGGCNIPCAVGGSCQNGSCACPAGQAACGGQCLDTTTNLAHCGGCNMPCNGTCQDGVCTPCTATNLYLFADVSGSMSFYDATNDLRLAALRGGINAFMNNALSANMGIGIGYHPILGPTGVCTGTTTPCTPTTGCSTANSCDLTSCAQADYQIPAVEIALLPGNKAAITSSLNSQVASGNSMPPPGYRGALEYARTYALAHPTEKVAVVLIADDLPKVCNTTANAPTDLLPIAQQYSMGTPKVNTYVIGIGSGLSPDPTQAQWNQVAAAGGTTTAFMANSSTAVTNALNSIRTQFKTCP